MIRSSWNSTDDTLYMPTVAPVDDSTLTEAANQGDLAVALGAEGAGLRRLVRENCDVSAHIPMASAIGSLNVSNAAAIAFYELTRVRTP